MSDNGPQVSVVIVTHNSLPALSDCLQALRTAVDGITHELILVDNASADGSIAEAERVFPEVQVIGNKKNVGFATACNQGAAAARGVYLLFLNPDVILDRDAVGVLIATARSCANAGLVSGRLRNSDGSFQPTCRRFPTIGNMIFSRGSALAGFFGGGDTPSGRYTLADYHHTQPVPAVAATMVLVVRALFEEVGGFDRHFFMYMEDTDLSLRLHQHGRVNLFVPGAGGVHRWGEGSRCGRVQRLLRHHQSVWKYFLKHFPNGFSVVVLPALLLLNFVWLIVMPQKKLRGGMQ